MPYTDRKKKILQTYATISQLPCEIISMVAERTWESQKQGILILHVFDNTASAKQLTLSGPRFFRYRKDPFDSSENW